MSATCPRLGATAVMWTPRSARRPSARRVRSVTFRGGLMQAMSTSLLRSRSDLVTLTLRTDSRGEEPDESYAQVAMSRRTVNSVADQAPTQLRTGWANQSPALADILYRPDEAVGEGLSLDAALKMLAESAIQAPDSLIPVTFVDDWSFACLTLDDNRDYGWRKGQIVRWHLDSIDPAFQGAVLDVGVKQYIESLIDELGPAWDTGYDGMVELADSYRANFVEKGITPKSHDRRPFQLACQNVIIGLAAFQRDPRNDGSSVPFWLTCEAPHVATYEGTRALSALMLCDAFQSGGTMEIAFERHPERKVPASLRRFGRSRGINLGLETRGRKNISPAESRSLFWDVTPMPNPLREGGRRLIKAGICSVERFCYTILAPVWSAPALDFLISSSNPQRISSILEGGCNVTDRQNRMVEMELMRAACLFETFVKCSNTNNTAVGLSGDVSSTSSVLTFEDRNNGVRWTLYGEESFAEVQGLPPGPVPWLSDLSTSGRIIVIPRPHPIAQDFELANRLAVGDLAAGAPVVVLTDHVSTASDSRRARVLRSPMRLQEIDLQIEQNLTRSRLARA